MNEQPPKRDWFFWFFAAYAVLAMINFGLLLVDFVTHPLAPDAAIGTVMYRLFLIFVPIPIGLTVSILVLRRTRGNVTGLFLLIYTSTIMTGTLRVDSPLQTWSLLLSSSWLGLWLLPLYFPDGHAHPARFEKWIRLHSVVTAILFVGVNFFHPTIRYAGPSTEMIQTANPLYITALAPIAAPLRLVQFGTWISSVLLIVPSIFLRYRASSGIVRQQIKWFVTIFTILITTYIALFFILAPLMGESLGTIMQQTGIASIPLMLFYGLFFPLAPFVAVGYAILRHRLYDIDLIIRRTLIYSTITALLAGVYFGGVALMQNLFVSIAGQQSPLAVVASTLAIAALFAPLRRRVQDFVDRRFYRQKYDAQKTLEAFAVTMRDEVDMESLKAQLVSVVHDTMQPTTISLWVREPAQKGETR